MKLVMDLCFWLIKLKICIMNLRKKILRMVMAIGERIHYFRLLRGFTQKYLGKLLGFSDSQADVRIAQYEKGARSPKEKYLNALAQIFEVSPHALNVPDIDTDIGLMHTLFTLEDTRGLKIGKLDGELCLRLDKDTGMTYHSMWDMLRTISPRWSKSRRHVSWSSSTRRSHCSKRRRR